MARKQTWWAEERDGAWWITDGKESWRMVSKFNADSLVRLLNRSLKA